MRQLAGLDHGDDEAVTVLDALRGIPINSGCEILIGFLLDAADESARCSAAWALSAASEPPVIDALAVAAKSESSRSVRLSALGALQRRARESDIDWLTARIQDSAACDVERSRALEAAVFCLSRNSNDRKHSRRLQRLILHCLTPANGTLAATAATLARHAGTAVAPRLPEICRDASADGSVREAACRSLGELKHRAAAAELCAVLAQERDVVTVADGDLPRPAATRRLAQAAAEALTRIDPAMLLDLPGGAAKAALAKFALKSGALVYEDRIIDANGQVVGGSVLSVASGCSDGATADSEEVETDRHVESRSAVFSLKHKTWELHFAGLTVHETGRNLGLHYIRFLLQQPYQPIAALQLLQWNNQPFGTSNEPRIVEQLGSDSARPDQEYDDDAIADFRRRIDELGEEIAEAKAAANVNVQEKLMLEREQVVETLKQAYSPHGKRLLVSPEQKKARTSVSNAIGRSIKKLEQEHPRLHKHLDNSIRTGHLCSYEPESRVEWLT